jgi:hypothetical protein
MTIPNNMPLYGLLGGFVSRYSPEASLSLQVVIEGEADGDK